MQALRLKLHQHNAVYRNPSSGEIVESYPLVPPSTILGLISAVLKQQELRSDSFNLSIQGSYGTLMRDYQWHKKYDEKLKGYQERRYPLLVHSLFDVDLLIHIFAHQDAALVQLSNIFCNPPYFLYLGRAEDIIKINEVNIVNIKKLMITESLWLQHNAYISSIEAAALQIYGVTYYLSSYSKLVPWTRRKQTIMIRNFEWTDVVYVEKGTMIEPDEHSTIECWSDGENLIWWSLPNPPQ